MSILYITMGTVPPIFSNYEELVSSNIGTSTQIKTFSVMIPDIENPNIEKVKLGEVTIDSNALKSTENELSLPVDITTTSTDLLLKYGYGAKHLDTVYNPSFTVKIIKSAEPTKQILLFHGENIISESVSLEYIPLYKGGKTRRRRRTHKRKRSKKSRKTKSRK
jgi:hypothetical protein